VSPASRGAWRSSGSLREVGSLLIRLRHAELAAAYLAAWPDPARRDAAAEALGELGRAVGLKRLGARIGRSGVARLIRF
jgi:hypothetical protein